MNNTENDRLIESIEADFAFQIADSKTPLMQNMEGYEIDVTLIVRGFIKYLLLKHVKSKDEEIQELKNKIEELQQEVKNNLNNI